ncbi:MAG TPA: AAA family ATPase [Actinocrinis sp.]|uniref:AAA family ATPase n=1 Tax=Actinocrinis sp. TaxID=1920516 RepID=UPI002DDD9E27|nr:AAA family ATPase [Actinocrinis sp.]HEV2347314.1 AAA family ATPase [Actinocrinis sp.]
MANEAATEAVLERYLKARIPFVTIRTSERARALPILKRLAQRMQLDVATHTLTRGVYNLGSDKQLSVDKSLWSAMEYAGDQFQKRGNLTFVFTDVHRISDDNEETRQLLDLITAAPDRDCSVVVITADPVWSALQLHGMTVTLDPPDFDELVKLVHAVLDPYRGTAGVAFDWAEAEYREAASVLRGVSYTQAINLLSVLLADRSVTKADLPKLSREKDAVFSDLTGIERIVVSAADADVAGLRGLTTWLAQRRKLLTMDLRDRGSGPPRGVLLIGVPGCGKSLSAKAVSVRWQLPLYRLDMASVLGMWVGQSEGRLRSALEMADRAAPCVLWIDEIEKGLAGSRAGRDTSGVSTRMVGQFLFWLQESKSGAFVVATANDISSLPPELLRHGRFDATFFVDLPDPEERREMVQLYAGRYLKTVLDDELLAHLVDLSEGFTGAEIDHALKEVMRLTLTSDYSTPWRDLYVQMFKGIVPFSRSQPEALERLRKMRDRAIPASGRPVWEAAAANAPDGAGTVSDQPLNLRI